MMTLTSISVCVVTVTDSPATESFVLIVPIREPFRINEYVIDLGSADTVSFTEFVAVAARALAAASKSSTDTTLRYFTRLSRLFRVHSARSNSGTSHIAACSSSVGTEKRLHIQLLRSDLVFDFGLQRLGLT